MAFGLLLTEVSYKLLVSAVCCDREVHGAARNDRGDGMFVNHLGDRIAKQYDVLIKRFNLALQFDAVDEINRDGDVLATELVQERVLQKLAFVIAHDILRVPK
jgi:hypothetical protein